MGEAKIRCPKCNGWIVVKGGLVECDNCDFIQGENYVLGFWAGVRSTSNTKERKPLRKATSTRVASSTQICRKCKSKDVWYSAHRLMFYCGDCEAKWPSI